jgi:hypothetical protein
VHRTASTGELLVEMVAHFVQTRGTTEDLGGLKYRCGVTMIANIDGRVRYLIRKPFHEERIGAMRAWLRQFDDMTGSDWKAQSRPKNRLTEAFSARALDGRRWR